MAEFPAMPLWTDALMADTTHLSTAEFGAYMLLLVAMWRSGGKLPNDEKRLARFCRLDGKSWLKVRDHVMEFFTVIGDDITQKRLQKEMLYVRNRSEAQSNRAKARYLKNNEVELAVADAGQAPGSAPTPTPTPIEDKKAPAEPKKGTRIPADFEADLEFAMREGLTKAEAQREAASFRDFWISKPGKDGVKLDWVATWRNWVRNGIKRKRGPPGGKSAFAQHQDEVTQSFRNALQGTEHEQPSRPGEQRQPSFDLESGDFFSDRTASASKR